MNTILAKVKLALRIVADDFNQEITDLINAALLDLGIAGIDVNTLITVTTGGNTYNDLLLRAVITYCKANFGDASDGEYDRLKASYDEQKAQMQMATGYTDWLT